jgi:uncharacterized membrane protein (TIGR02234 family)
MGPPARSARLLALGCLGLAAAAGLLWGASAIVWLRVTPPGRSTSAFTGAQVAPSLTGFALVALAGVAALVATGGVVRRVLAGLLGVAGVAVAWTGVQVLTRTGSLLDGVAGTGAGPPPTVAPADLATTAAPLLAGAAGLVLLAVAVFVVLREPRLARLGARYAAPGKRPVEIDPDRAAWQALDAGRDPTADAGDDPSRGAG